MDSNQLLSKSKKGSGIKCIYCGHKNTDYRAYGIDPMFMQIACFDCGKLYTTTPMYLFLSEIELVRDVAKRMGLDGHGWKYGG